MKEVTNLAFTNANIPLVEGLSEQLERLRKRIHASNLSESMCRSYCRSVRDLCLYTGLLPVELELELDEIIDYLLFLNDKGLSWGKIKLDVAHHYVTFTVPSELRGLFYHNQKVLYHLLFKSRWATLCSFSKDPRSRLRAEIEVISILHTWTQKLEYHPHLHCIVPSGGLSHGQWKPKQGKFLFSVKALGLVFRNKLCDAIKTMHNAGVIVNKQGLNPAEFTQFIAQVRKKKWVVNSKPGFAGRASVLEYLGRYTHKIAISNYRLVSLKDGRVTFTYRERKAGDVKKVMSLTVEEFIQRFSWHILPKGFIKIRHYGLFSTRTKQVKLALVRASLGEPQNPKPAKLTIAEVIFQITGRNIHLCPCC